MSIDFIIPARNEEKFLADCLESIRNQVIPTQTPESTKVIVVDNESTDRTREIALAHNAIVLSTRRSNAATTRNTGANANSAEFIAFLDADCVLPERWLATCLEHFDSDSVVAVGASQAYSGPSAPWIERTWTDLISPRWTHEHETANWLPAFNLIVRRSAFKQVGGFDESLVTCEDSDLTYRLSAIGDLILDHTVQVRHLGESQRIKDFFQREMWRSRGNYRSAAKRKQILKEIKSTLIPNLFISVLLITFCAPMLAFYAPRLAAFLVFFGIVVSAGLPLFVAFRKGTHQSLLSKSIAVFIYLIARGLGPFARAKRVSR